MTDNRATELLPCPFCGGKASRMLNGNEDDYFWWVECCECNATIDSFATSTEAIEVWNTRAERTCKPKWTLQGTTQTQEFWRCDCGNCDECFGVEDRRGYVTLDKVEIPNYCPSCGVRIEVERCAGTT